MQEKNQEYDSKKAQKKFRARVASGLAACSIAFRLSEYSQIASSSQSLSNSYCVCECLCGMSNREETSSAEGCSGEEMGWSTTGQREVRAELERR